MSRPVKKFLRILLSLAMVISLLPAVTLTAHAAVLYEDFDLLPPQESARSDNPSISLGGFTYSTDSADDALRIGTIAEVTGLLTSMGSANALSSNWYGTNTGTYFQFKSTDPTDDFKLNSFEAQVFAHSSMMSEIYTITGYNNDVSVATATVNFAVSNTYGSDKSAISYTRQTIPSEEGASNAGKLTFIGSDWSNIDQLRMTVADSAPNSILRVVIDNIDISSPVIPNTSPTFLGGATGTLTVNADTERVMTFDGSNEGAYTFAIQGTGLSSTAPMANFGTAMDLGGNTYATIVPDASQNVTTQFTIETWIKRTGAGDNAAYVFSRNGGENTGQWAVVSGNGGLRFYVGALDVGMYTGDNSKIPINDMLWHHIAYAYNGSVLTFYLDGAQVGQYTSTFSLPTDPTSFYIGNAANRNNPTYDALDELRLWSTCRTQEQIKSTMYRSISSADADYSSLVFYCQFEEGSGQSVKEFIKGKTGSVWNNSGTAADGSWISSSDINPSWTTAENTPLSGYLVGSDADGDALTYSIVTNGEKGTASITAGTNMFTYTPNVNANGADSFAYTVSDKNSSSSPQAVSITVTPVNDAPVISAPASITVIEDIAKTLTGIMFSDADAGGGIATATFAVPTGTLSASSGGGVTVDGTASALMLTGTFANINAYIAASNLSYVPAPNASGSVTLTVSVNDNGYTGGGGAQTASTTVQLNIIPVNDAPALGNANIALTDTDENQSTASIFVSAIVKAANVQDADTGDSLGVALTASWGSGTWQYSMDGFTWSNVGTVSANATLLLSPATRLRYLPDGKNGGTAAITFRAWDQTFGSASINGVRSTADATTNGGTTAFSAGTAQATLNVSSVNDAPVLTPMAPSLTGITTSETGNSGQTVLSFADSAISDVDTGARKGIAIVTTADGSGKWQFFTDPGDSWADVEAVSQTSALLLRSIDKVRFVPGGPDATTASITYRAWDTTSGSQGNKADVTTNGGTTAYSTATDTASIAVVADTYVTNVTSTAANGVYKAGDEITIMVAFNKTVTVTGTPHLTLETGTTNRVASYASGSGTSTLSFTYTVQAGDASRDLEYAGTGALSTNGGTIQTASLILPAPGEAGSLGDNTDIEIDGIAPTITSVSVPANRSYKAGEVLSFAVNFNEAMTVTTAGGTPALALTIGSETHYAAYVSGHGSTSLTFSYTVQPGDNDTNGIALTALILDGESIKDIAGNDAQTVLSNVGSTSGILVDAVTPVVSGIARQTPSSEHTNASAVTFRVTFSELVENVSTDDFELTVAGTAGGTVTSLSVSSGAVIDVSVSGISGDGALRLNLKSGTDIADAAGNVSAGGYTNGEAYMIDKTTPVPGNSGVIATSDIASSSIKLTWTSAADAASLQYKVVYSTSDNISTVSDTLSNGTTSKDWTADMTAFTVTGLSAGTGYYFNVLVQDAAGNVSVYTAATTRTSEPSSGGSTTGSGNNSVAVIVNGQPQTAGTLLTTTNTSGQTVTTVTVDTGRLENLLATQGSGAMVTIPVTGGSDVAAGTLTGAMVKSMEDKAATLVIQTNTGSYTLPASEINIGAVSEQLGTSVSLADISVTVSISDPSASMAQVVENAAQDGGYTIMVPAVDYTITCTYGGQTVNVSSFSAYVERTIIIPDGIDPARITTGVIVDPDGTVFHVPTRVKIIDGKHYAVINSLTNSTYSVIWNPVEFSDAASHWAKDAINNMGSRIVVTGIGNNQYAPNRSMTRAEFAAVMVRALGLEPGTGASGFSDVASTDWCSGYIKTAAAYGIITGYGNGSFGPNETITREQAMTMLARAMEITGLDTGLTEHEIGKLLETYSDGSAISAYARSSVAACIKTNITSGTSTAALSPKAAITRAEVAVMTERLLQKSGLI